MFRPYLITAAIALAPIFNSAALADRIEFDLTPAGNSDMASMLTKLSKEGVNGIGAKVLAPISECGSSDSLEVTVRAENGAGKSDTMEVLGCDLFLENSPKILFTGSFSERKKMRSFLAKKLVKAEVVALRAGSTPVLKLLEATPDKTQK